MSRARRNGLIRLVVLVVLVGWLAVLALNGLFSSGSHNGSSSTPVATRPSARLKATISPLHLPQPLHGATAAPTSAGLLVIGGADRSDVSTDGVLLLDPRGGSVSSAGKLVTAMHDAAATTLSGRTLVFGGGASTAFDTVQELERGGTARRIGAIPSAVSDLSAVTVGDAAYVLGGFDGQSPVASVLRTTDGHSVRTVASLPTAVRYTAAAATGGKIYTFGGELGTGADTDLIQSYDTATQRTSSVGHLAAPVSHAAAVTLGGTIYVLGGRRNGAGSNQILRFDPSRKTVVRAGRLPSPVYDGAACTASGSAYLAGGIGAAGTSVDSILTVHP